MTCDPIEDLLPGYLDGELSLDVRRRVEEHLAACASCRALLQDVRRVDQIVAGWPDPPDEMRSFLTDIDDAVLGRVRRERRSFPSLILARRALRLAVTAAIVVVAIGLGAALLVMGSQLNRSRQTTASAPSRIARPLFGSLRATAAPRTPLPGQSGLLGSPLADVVQVTVTDYREASSKTARDRAAFEPAIEALAGARFVRHDATLESQIVAQTYAVHLGLRDGSSLSLIYWPGGGSLNVENPGLRDWWDAPGLDSAIQPLLPSPPVSGAGNTGVSAALALTATPTSPTGEEAVATDRLPSPARSIAVPPGQSATVYALLASNAFYRSDDGGRTWRPMPLPAAQNTDRSPTGAGGQDTGRIPSGQLDVRATDADRVFVVADHVLYGSQDGGTSWKALIDAVYAWTVADQSGDVLYVWHGTVPFEPGGLYRTGDAGRTWQEVYDGDFPPALRSQRCPCNHEGIGALIADPHDPDTLYAGTDYGIFRSADAGKTWAALSSGLAPSRFYRWTPILAAVPDGTIYALTDVSPDYTRGSAALIRLRPGDSAWTTVTSSALDRWQSPDAPFYGFETLVADPSHPGRLYVGSEQGLLKSDDGGATWRLVQLPPAHRVFEISIAAGSKDAPTTLYLWTDNGFVTWGDEGNR